MRLAYLAKRAKPELSVAVSYLSTQVTKPTKYDMCKLDRCIRYVNENIGAGIRLTAEGTGKSVKLRGFIDASFGCHDDGKSHTGVLVTLGSGPVYVRSVKQRIVTKSCIESEIVALSDEAGSLLRVKSFIESQGYCVELSLVENSRRTIKLLASEQREWMRTKYINVRYYWLRDRIKNDDFNLKYGPTGMTDILTKPLQGSLFRQFVQRICGRA